jgi:hypothetical protein
VNQTPQQKALGENDKNEQNVTNERPVKSGDKKRAKRRNRKSAVAEKLLIVLDDRTYLNFNQTELANLLDCAESSICRAFQNPKYRPQLVRKYEEYKLTPPTGRKGSGCPQSRVLSCLSLRRYLCRPPLFFSARFIPV